ncbi:MAG: hypothetical protein RIB84_00615 [Sneathiellaceae bacterium]
MVDSVTFLNVTVSTTLLDSSGYNTPTTANGKTLPLWIAAMWDAALFMDSKISSAAQALAATSESSVAVGSGSKVFAVGTDRGFAAGTYVLAARTADPTGTWMLGQVASYAAGDLTITVGASDYAGAGTHSDWTLGISGPRGATGPASLSAGQAWGYILSMH